jgi:hypothetical protein
MTLASTPPIVDYVEDGATLIHAIPFQFNISSEIVCTRIPDGGAESAPLTQGTDYTVTGGSGATGTVTKTAGGTVGGTFRIRRLTQETQATTYASSGTFPTKDVEKSLDRAMAVVQEIDTSRQLLENRAIRGPAGDSFPALPAASSRVSKFMQWAANGKSLVLLTVNDLAQLLAGPLAALIGGGLKGDPGGNIMAIGLFTGAFALNIPVGTDVVRTAGYSVKGIGIADYVADAAVDAAYVAVNPRTSFISANARGFRLAAGIEVLAAQFGVLDTAADNAAALQAAYDWAAANKRILRIAKGDFKIGAAINFNVAGMHVYGAGWENTRLITTAATPAIIIKSRYGETRGIGCDGRPDGVTKTGTYGIVHKDAASHVTDNCDCRGFVNDGCLIDPTFGGGADGNNNIMIMKGGHYGQNGGCGIRMKQHGDNNGISFLDGLDCSGNTSHGMLLKASKYYVDVSCIVEGNQGYGIQIGEDTDIATNVDGVINRPWVEANVLGGVHGSAMSANNQIILMGAGQGYSRHVNAGDTVEIITGGGHRRIGSIDGVTYVEVTGLGDNAFITALKSTGGDANLYISASGAGSVNFLSPVSFASPSFDIEADNNIISTGGAGKVGAKFVAGTEGGAYLSNGAGTGYLEVYSNAGVRQGYCMFSDGAGGLLFDAEGAHTHFQFADPVNLNGVPLQYNGVQVVAGQQTGCPAAATDAATTQALANFLRTALLAHGLIHA